MLKYMYVQDVVEKKLTNLAHISTKQNKADLMTKCHTSEAHKRSCALIGLRLAWNRTKKWRCNVRRSQSAAMKKKWQHEDRWRSVRSSEEMWDQDTVSRPQGRVWRITQVFGQVSSKSFFINVKWIHVWWQFWQVEYFSMFFLWIWLTMTSQSIRSLRHWHCHDCTRNWSRQGESDCSHIRNMLTGTDKGNPTV